MATDRETFLADVLAGLGEPPSTLPTKYLYDARGSALFDRICALEAYYPTRTELGILAERGPEIGAACGPNRRVVELGSGSSNKTQALLDHLPDPAMYVPVDISPAPLAEAAERVAETYPGLTVRSLCADYARPLDLPQPARPADGDLLYFPGSTIGNFDPEEATAFLAGLAQQAGPGGQLLIGVDLIKDRAVLRRAYDDPEGVTAAFNHNLLTRLRNELDADLDPAGFAHQAPFNEDRGCVEMHLVAQRPQTIRVGGEAIPFAAGDSIRTERSYKYSLAGFRQVAGEAGWQISAVWTDPQEWFSVQLLEARPSRDG